MSILPRYLLRTYLPSFSLALGLFLFVLLMNYFLRLFNLAVMKGIDISWVFLCFARLMPYFLSLALPMAFLVALLLTLGQLSENGEVMALRSSGFSFQDILKPFFGVAVGLTGLLFLINHQASPRGFHAFKESYATALSQISRLEVEERAMTRLGNWELYADRVGPKDGEIGGVRLIKRQGRYGRLRIAAPSGTTRLEKGRGIHLELREGSLIWPNAKPTSHTTSTFERSELFIPFVDDRQLKRKPELIELPTPTIRALLREGDLDEQKRKEYTTEAAVRSAGAVAPFVLFFVACPLGLRLEKRSRAIGFALSLGVMFGYYGLLAVGIGLGRRDLAWSPWSPWLPDVASLLVGAALWWRLVKR